MIMGDTEKKKKRKNLKICNSKFLKRLVNHLNCENFKHTTYWTEKDVFEIRYVHMKSSFFEPKVLDLFKDMDRLFGEKYPTNTAGYCEKCKVRFKSNIQRSCEREWLKYVGEDRSVKGITKRKYRFIKYPSGTACKFGEPRLLDSNNAEDFLLTEDCKVQLLPQGITSNQTLMPVTISTDVLIPLATNALSLPLEMVTSNQNLIPVTIPVVLKMAPANIFCGISNDQVQFLDSSSGNNGDQAEFLDSSSGDHGDQAEFLDSSSGDHGDQAEFLDSSSGDHGDQAEFLDSSSGDHGDQAEFMDCISNDLHKILEPVSDDETKILRHISDCEAEFLECHSDDKVGSALCGDSSGDQKEFPDSSYYQVELKLPESSKHSVWTGCLADTEDSYNLNNVECCLNIPKTEKNGKDLGIEKESETENMKQNDPLILSAWEDNRFDCIESTSDGNFTWSLEENIFM